MARYRRLSLNDRIRIKEYLELGLSFRKIAQELHYAPSSILFEVRRGSKNQGRECYDPYFAEEDYREKMDGRGIQAYCTRYPKLAQEISNLILKEQLTPEAAAQRLRENPLYQNIAVSYVTIYRAVSNGLIPGVTRDKLHNTKLGKKNRVQSAVIQKTAAS